MLAVCRAKSCSSRLQTTADDDRDYFSEIHERHHDQLPLEAVRELS